MKKISLKSPEAEKQNLRIEKNEPDYLWLKKHYSDPNIASWEREYVDFYDRFITCSVGKYQMKQLIGDLFPEGPTHTIALVGKYKSKKFIVEKYVDCRLLFDGPLTYEILSRLKKSKVEINHNGVYVLKTKKL